MLTVLQGVDSLWETDLMRPLIDKASELTGRSYTVGDYDDRDSFAIRVLAEHARSTAMLVADGVFPSNEARGYVLRRIIRRAVRYAYLLGTDKIVLPELAEVAVDVMGNAYPDVARQRDFIVGVLGKEEENFRHTLRNGLVDPRARAGRRPGVRPRPLSGSTAFALHDTYGFPLELTQEIASERGVAVDLAGFETEMAEQRRRAKAARGVHREHANVDAYRRIVENHGVTTFLGYVADNAVARVLDVLDVPRGDDNGDGDGELVEIFLDETPFYAESGGQVGDTGSISTETGTAEVLDTTFALPNLRRHTARIVAGTITAGQAAAVAIDVERRNSIRRNHTATHLVHHALREVLGEHVKQAGSLVAPDRLRFDFSHYAPLSADEITAHREPGQRRDAGQHAGARLRDLQARGRESRRHRLLRREVRRRRPGPRGGQFCRALWWDPRRARRATSARSRSSARDRSGRTCDASRPSPARVRLPCCNAMSTTSARSPTSSAPPVTRPAAFAASSTSCAPSTTRTSNCAPSWRAARRASSPTVPSTAS